MSGGAVQRMAIATLKADEGGWLVEVRSYGVDDPIAYRAWYADENEAVADYHLWQTFPAC